MKEICFDMICFDTIQFTEFHGCAVIVIPDELVPVKLNLFWLWNFVCLFTIT